MYSTLKHMKTLRCVNKEKEKTSLFLFIVFSRLYKSIRFNARLMFSYRFGL